MFTLGLGVDIGGQSMSDRLGQWETAFLAALVIVMVIMAPEGLVGLFRRGVSPLLRWLQPPAPVDGPVVMPVAKHIAEPGTSVLDVTDLTLTFGGLAALSGVNLAIECGTIHALIGPNGSGKSTLVNVITGIYRSDSGKVRFGGDDLTATIAASLRPRRRRAHVPELSDLASHDRARERAGRRAHVHRRRSCRVRC